MKRGLMNRLFRRCAAHMRGWKVYLGRDPRNLPGRCLVFFPVQPDVICCGLAGILVIKGSSGTARNKVFEEFSGYAARIRENRFGMILEGHIAPLDYLCPEALEAFEKGIYSLKQDPSSQREMFYTMPADRLEELVSHMKAFMDEEQGLFEQHAQQFSTKDMEAMSRSLITFKDIVWGLGVDLLGNQVRILDLCGGTTVVSEEVFGKYQRINFTLNALDRLEVRGRDSCGVQVALTFGTTGDFTSVLERIKQDGVYEEFMKRCRPGDVWDRSIHIAPHSLIFTYKTALINGDLGDNTKRLRGSIETDPVIRSVVSFPSDSEMYLAHTRWASVGAINEANCHPVNNFCVDPSAATQWDFTAANKTYPYYGRGPWTINVVLNGDIDNYVALKDSLESESWLIDSRITTDTKVIPLQVERYLYEGHDLKEAFRKALNDFEGSHAIALESNLEPGKVFLALRGSGQSIYVGISNNQLLFSSEIYGLVEETPRFIKMDGERQHKLSGDHTRGQIFVLRNDKGPGIGGIEALYYDGHHLELTENDIQCAQITTRDIDRGDFPHYLIKEILDAPNSVRKTMLGKYQIRQGSSVVFNLDDDVMPGKIRESLTGGRIQRIYVVGQGTAAIAAAAVAEAISIYLKGTRMAVQARKASDLSGFCLDDDMSDCLVIAITQSGTTTDTNRAVAMAKERGAHLLAIVNRRQSDITNKVDGVFYTSDGRDIEMSVASTKAFYSQITAGYILALYLAKLVGTLSDERIALELTQLEKAPELMARVIEKKASIRQSAWDLVRKKKYWAVVGSGTNKVASDEIRIKLSELCYKTISSDIVEDKKHIDLSSEPLIVVCSAGTPKVVLEDIVKDVAIFHAHAARVVVIADQGEKRFEKISDSVVSVPRSTFPLSVILNTLAGHIWGYYAACSLDAQAGSFKAFRTKIAEVMRDHDERNLSLYESLEDRELLRSVDDFSSIFNSWRRSGALASMNVETASDIALLLKYAVGKLPIEDFWSEFGVLRASSSPLDMLDASLGRAIDELSRPVDAIRHQAKTVTVGTSRKIEAPRGLLFEAMEYLHFSLENLSAREGVRLKRLQDAVLQINGYTLYEVGGLDDDGKPTDESTVRVIQKYGLAQRMHSRVEETGKLMGTKKTIVRTTEVYAGDGKSDNASIIIVPLIGSGRIVENLLLLHVDFREDLSVEQKKEVLGDKFNDISNLIDEYNLAWDDSFLQRLPVKFLLGGDTEAIAREIQKSLDAK